MANDRHTMFFMGKEYPNVAMGGGSGGGGGYVEKWQVGAANYRGYNLIATHEDGSTSLTQTVPSTGEASVVFEIPKAGVWTLSNSKDGRTLVHNVNVVADMFGGINSPFTLDLASDNINQTVQCSAGYYVVLIGTTGRGTEAGYSPVGVAVNNGTIIAQQKVFDSANPLVENWCSDMRVIIVEATSSTTITSTAGSCDRARIMVLHTTDQLTANSIKLVGTKKDSTFTGTCNIDEGHSCLFFLGTDGYSKTVTGNDYSATSQYESGLMGYDYGTATASTTLSISFWGGSSYGSAGVAVIG